MATVTKTSSGAVTQVVGVVVDVEFEKGSLPAIYDALHIDHTLHEQLSDRLAGLLQCGDEAAGEDAAEEPVIEDQLIPDIIA